MKHPLRINEYGKVKRRRRFHVIDRAVQRAKREIMAQEDVAMFKRLNGFAQSRGK